MDNLSNVAYKNGNILRYSLWSMAAICITLLISTFLSTLNGEISAAIPDGYRFSVTDNYTEGSKLRTTYYVYNDHILVEDESFEADSVNRVVLIYDNINTSTLVLDKEDTTEICEYGAFYAKPKVLATIKKLISRKAGHEYIGF